MSKTNMIKRAKEKRQLKDKVLRDQVDGDSDDLVESLKNLAHDNNDS